MFYKTSKLKLVKHENIVLRCDENTYTNQVSIILHLQHIESSKEIVVATTHLKAKYGWHQLRYEQGKYLVNYLIDNYKKQAIVLCGDFNADANEKVYEEVKSSALEVSSAYCLLSENKQTEPEYTTWKIRGGIEKEQEACATIDFIFYRSKLLNCTSLLELPTAEEIGVNRLPSAFYPSDHLSLGAVFTFV